MMTSGIRGGNGGLAAISAACLLGLAGIHGPLRAQDPPASEAPIESLRLQFPNNSVADILGIYELLTGKAVVKDSDIFDGPTISLVTAKEVSREEAIRLIEASLQINGYVLVPEPDGSTVRVLEDDAELSAISEGLEVHRTPSTLPEGRSIASYFLRLEYLDPSEAVTAFYSHVGLNEYGRLTPVSSPAGILITENTAAIRQFIRLSEVLDVPQDQSNLVTRFYDLEYTSAAFLGEIINATFDTRQPLPTVTGDTMGDQTSRVPQRRETAIEPRVVADDRLNRLMVVAQPIDHKYVEEMVAEFDRPIRGREPFERALKYVFVDELLPVLVDVIQDTGTGVSLLPDGDTVRTRLPPQASTESSTLTGRVRRGVQRANDETTQVGGLADMLLDPLENAAPISVLVGSTRIIADVQANKILAFGQKEDIEKINTVIDKLDRKPPQVYLATVIGQLTLGDGIEFGVDYLARFRETGDGGYGFSFITNDPLRRVISSLPDLPGSGGGIGNGDGLPIAPIPLINGLTFYGQIQDDLGVVVRALESSQRFQVLSRPVVYASNNKKAVIASGRRVPIPTSSVSSLDNDSNVLTNIEFEDVVLKLEVVPLINSTKEVSLTIAQINDTIVGEQVVGDNTVPIIGTEQLTTSVTIPNRNTIVLGGLISEEEEKVTEGLPFVSRIPYVGNAFKSTRRDKVRKELIIFIQPVVVEDNTELAEASLDEDLRTDIGEEAFLEFPDVPTASDKADPPPVPVGRPVPRPAPSSRPNPSGVPSSARPPHRR